MSIAPSSQRNRSITSGATGIVIISHGGESSHLHSRHQFLAGQLCDAGFAIVEPWDEQDDGNWRRELALDELPERLIDAADWVLRRGPMHGFRLGYFGAGIGAAAALNAAAERPELVSAVVCLGGRLDLTESLLSRVQAPTLLIVGGEDDPAITRHRWALGALRCEKHLVIISDGSQLFEPGLLEQAAIVATHWFEAHLCDREEVAAL